MKIIGKMGDPVIKKEQYFFFLEAGIPYEGWVDYGNGELVYALKEVEIVSIQINKYNDHFLKPISYADVIGKGINLSMDLTNLAVGGFSTYYAYKGDYLKSNEFWRYQPYGKNKIITPWSKTANNQNYWNNNFAKQARINQLEKVAKYRNISNKLTKAGGVLIVADITLSGEIKPSHGINAFMLGLSLTTGVGAIVAGVWFIADFGTMGVNYLINGEAKGIGDMLDEKIGHIDLYDGLY
jgi:hypothetical protein